MTNKIIVNPQDQIACPHCAKQFELREALSHQLIEGYEAEYTRMLAKERSDLTVRIEKDIEIKQARLYDQQLDELKDQLAESQSQVLKNKSQLVMAKKKAAEQAKFDAMAESSALKEELETKDLKLAEFREAELQLRKEKKAVEEKQADLALELERKVEAERKTIEARVSELYALKEADLRKKISDAQKSNDELTRKLEQGSQQLQGEVLELEVERILETAFPFDVIEPVKKGVQGADVIQTVHQSTGKVCGKVVWEVKRTKNWSNNWVPKLKDDLQIVGGDIAVLVTTAFPNGVDEAMLVHEGVWLVKPELAKGLSVALRTVLIEAQRQKAISAGKGEQMEALFDYICSNQFAQRIRSVVEGYEEMQIDLDKEKRAMQKIWKKREGQISRLSTQVISVCGELQGISSSALPLLDSIAELDFISESVE